MRRRDFLKTSFAASSLLAASQSLAATTHQPNNDRKIATVAFPEKKPLITYSDRPPLLESPRSTFVHEFTPNDEFFVRWHLPDFPTHLDKDSFTITIDGLVEKEVTLTLKELQTRFEQVEINAVLQCGGNSRSAFDPIAGGIQWGSGAMGCAKWKGVRLKDILEYAGLKKNAFWIGLDGLDKPAFYKTPDFIREISLDELNDDMIIAYEMNGEDLPYLNGFPVRLVMPGFYSDSWIKMLSHITVYDKYQALFFMDVAYRVPDNKTHSETPQKKAKKTKPITHMNVKSLIGYPVNNQKVNLNSHVVVRGVAFDGGHGIEKVEVSLDGGKSWEKAQLKPDNGAYAFRGFYYSFKPTENKKIKIMARATNKLGQTQPFAHEIGWNHGGYMFNGIDEVTVEVV